MCENTLLHIPQRGCWFIWACNIIAAEIGMEGMAAADMGMGGMAAVADIGMDMGMEGMVADTAVGVEGMVAAPDIGMEGIAAATDIGMVAAADMGVGGIVVAIFSFYQKYLLFNSFSLPCPLKIISSATVQHYGSFNFRHLLSLIV